MDITYGSAQTNKTTSASANVFKNGLPNCSINGLPFGSTNGLTHSSTNGLSDLPIYINASAIINGSAPTNGLVSNNLYPKKNSVNNNNANNYISQAGNFISSSKVPFCSSDAQVTYNNSVTNINNFSAPQPPVFPEMIPETEELRLSDSPPSYANGDTKEEDRDLDSFFEDILTEYQHGPNLDTGNGNSQLNSQWMHPDNIRRREDSSSPSSGYGSGNSSPSDGTPAGSTCPSNVLGGSDGVNVPCSGSDDVNVPGSGPLSTSTERNVPQLTVSPDFDYTSLLQTIALANRTEQLQQPNFTQPPVQQEVADWESVLENILNGTDAGFLNGTDGNTDSGLLNGTDNTNTSQQDADINKMEMTTAPSFTTSVAAASNLQSYLHGYDFDGLVNLSPPLLEENCGQFSSNLPATNENNHQPININSTALNINSTEPLSIESNQLPSISSNSNNSSVCLNGRKPARVVPSDYGPLTRKSLNGSVARSGSSMLHESSSNTMLSRSFQGNRRGSVYAAKAANQQRANGIKILDISDLPQMKKNINKLSTNSAVPNGWKNHHQRNTANNNKDVTDKYQISTKAPVNGNTNGLPPVSKPILLNTLPSYTVKINTETLKSTKPATAVFGNKTPTLQITVMKPSSVCNVVKSSVSDFKPSVNDFKSPVAPLPKLPLATGKFSLMHGNRTLGAYLPSSPQIIGGVITDTRTTPSNVIRTTNYQINHERIPVKRNKVATFSLPVEVLGAAFRERMSRDPEPAAPIKMSTESSKPIDSNQPNTTDLLSKVMAFSGTGT